MKLVDIIKSRNGLNFLGADPSKYIDKTNAFHLERNIVDYDKNKTYTINDFSYKNYVHESYKYVSAQFKSRVKIVKNQRIRSRLLTYLYTFDGNFIGIDGDNITYQPYNKTQEFEGYEYLPKGRQSISAHKFLTKALKNHDFKEEDIKKAGDEMITAGKKYRLVFVEGEAIADAYADPDVAPNGWAVSSCMSGRPKTWFQLYADNPDVCKLGLIHDESNEIVGRFLYWFDNDTDKWFADRLYYKNEIVLEWHKDWCKEKEVPCYNLGFNDNFTVILCNEVRDYDVVPYMDTLMYTDGDNEISSCDGDYELQGQGGNPVNQTRDEIGEEYIDSDHAVSTYGGQTTHIDRTEIIGLGIGEGEREDSEILIWSDTNGCYILS